MRSSCPSGRHCAALWGKGYLDEEREMRRFLPHPVPRCFRKDAGTYKVLPRSCDKLRSFYGSGAGHLPLDFPPSASADLAVGSKVAEDSSATSPPYVQLCLDEPAPLWLTSGSFILKGLVSPQEGEQIGRFCPSGTTRGWRDQSHKWLGQA